MHAIAETEHRPTVRRGRMGSSGRTAGDEQVLGRCVLNVTGRLGARSCAELQAEVDGWAASGEAVEADGWAVVGTYTIVRGRDGARTGIVIG